MKVTVVGGGSWGTTVASLLANNAETVLWAREPEIVEAVGERGENPLFLEGVALHHELRATNDLAEALHDAEVVVMAVPSPYFRSVLEDAAADISTSTPILSLVKGLEQPTLQRMTEIIVEVLGADPARVGVLTGPNLAREVVAGQPSATVVAIEDQTWSPTLQRLFMTPTFRVYTSTDVIGCEIAGAIKNVIAIAAGIAAGMGFGENTKAALVTRGLAELTRLGVAHGGRPMTFSGLAGNGDLFATCSSPQSRNHRVGAELGKGRPLDEIIDEMHMVAEGVRTAVSVLAMAEHLGVEMPICEEVDEVLHHGRQPEAALVSLMEREAKPELDDLL